MICPRCGCSVRLLVDGRDMSEYELLALPSAPRRIERRPVHAVWCDSEDHLAQLAGRRVGA